MASLVLLGASILAILIAVVCRGRRTRWTASQMSPEDTERVRQRLCDWGFRQGQEHDPALAPIPVVVVSGTRDAVRRAAELWAAGCLEKPVGLDELVEAVRQHC